MTRWDTLLSDQELSRMAGLPFSEARNEVLGFLIETAAMLPLDVRQLLPDFSSVEDFSTSREIIETLDNKYFDLEDRGELVASSHAFAAARFASACWYFGLAENTDHLMNALYEAYHARI